MRSFSLAVVLTLCAPLGALFAAPSTALACACCDGGGTRELVGWSPRGSALTRVSESIACEARRYLEVWQPGERTPSRCFDLGSDTPGHPVACDGEMTDTEEFSVDLPVPASRRRFFPEPVTELDPNRIVAWLDAPNEEGEMLLHVSLTVGEALVPILSTPTATGAPEEYEDEIDDEEYERYPDDEFGPLTGDLPIGVRVFPSPDGTRAIVAVSGSNVAPGIGHFIDVFHAVSIPEAARGPGSAPNASRLPALALPAHSDARVPRRSHDAVTAMNRRGLALHRGGHHAQAAGAFVAALMLEPGRIMARYNLACALARLGRPAAAVRLLRDLNDAGCTRCRERMTRAMRDPDLASIRSRADFRALRTP